MGVDISVGGERAGVPVRSRLPGRGGQRSAAWAALTAAHCQRPSAAVGLTTARAGMGRRACGEADLVRARSWAGRAKLMPLESTDKCSLTPMVVLKVVDFLESSKL